MLQINRLYLVVFFSSCPLIGQVMFSDDFNRPDGAVGNGWSTWWDGRFNDPNTSIVNGELKTVGFGGTGGGIYRSLPVTFPLSFSFNFRTASTAFQCGSGSFNDGGWIIAFNMPLSSIGPNSPSGAGPAQFMLIHYSGQRTIIRGYWNGTNMVFDPQLLNGPVDGQRDYNATVFARIDGIVNSDLSSTVTIRYNDGRSPDPVVVSIPGAPAGTANAPLGPNLFLSNANCSPGPHYFDNFTINASAGAGGGGACGATDLSQDFRVQLGPYFGNLTLFLGFFSQSVSIRNNSAQPIYGPLSLVLRGLPSSTTGLVGGYPVLLTQCFSNPGDYLIPFEPTFLPLGPGDVLQPGQAIRFNLIYSATTAGIASPTRFRAIILSGRPNI